MEKREEKQRGIRLGAGKAVVYCLPNSLPFDGAQGSSEKMQHKEGRKLLSFALRNEYSIEFTEEMLRYGEHGKPMLKGGFPHFNISHCKGMVVCALADCPIGVDIEPRRRITEPLLRKVCTEEELFYVKGGSNSKELAFWEEKHLNGTNVFLSNKSAAESEILNFLKIWTLKESFLKMIGKGITIDMKEVQFEVEKEGEIQCNQGGFYKQEILREGYILSLCTEKPIKGLIIKYKNEIVESDKK